MPHRLGRYVVRRRIGAGGFATVWLAYDEQLDSPVAVKVLADNWTEDQHVRQRFQEEGRFLRRVESPHVVSVYDAGELDDGRPYLVMAYADQGTLADRLEAGVLPVPEALEVVRQVGAGLAALHERDVLHRDVKPANVLFRTVRGEVRAMVGDLGLGKALDMSSRLTMVAGTPTFVAPEQAQAEPLDARADQYSLGALAYLLLAGRAPYTHATLGAAAHPAPAPPLGTPERPFPAATDAVVRRALAVDREDRFPDVTAFVDALAATLHDADLPDGVVPGGGPAALPAMDPDLTQPGARPTARPEPPETSGEGPAGAPRPHRRRLVVPAAVTVAAVAVGAAVGYGWQSTRAEDVRVVDDQGSLSVEVPRDWERAVAADGWTPPNDDVTYPALSVGTTERWREPTTRAEGVFLGLFPGNQLPTAMPQHPECDVAQEPVTETTGDPSRTVVHTGCPHGVTVERVVQVAGNRLLWVQVRSADRATANEVLDSVDTHGI
ncbi:serine/threonine-protein kinase [Nocardioides sp. SYSU DS0663]|uniref:serine/threonine-protein kinase n=1 Tax=Nocardioides sp. SYSU DS0663 TaxID=3416445 RepID=UPI003F4C446C